MNKTVKTILIIAGFLLTAVITCFGTLFLVGITQAHQEGANPVYRKVMELQAYLDAYFIDDFDPEAVTTAAGDGAAAAMVEATGDRWSYYISAAEMASYEEAMANEYVGVGMTVRKIEEGMLVTDVTRDGPAWNSGIRIDDIVTQIEGVSVEELTLDEAVALVRGEAGTDVHFVLLRKGAFVKITATRAAIIAEVAVGQMLEGKIGYITVSNFDQHCAEQTLACVEDLMAQGAEALLFDMRFNGGGMKDEMVEILDALLPEGELFRSVDYAGKQEVDTSDSACIDLPMAVIVNEDSYSAAEFFAAALQEYGAAEVVGVQTSGKGNFQYTLPLSDGSAVALSVGKYFTPGGKSLTDVGIIPDVEVDLTYEDYEALYYGMLEQADDEQLQAAIEVLLTKIS